MAPQLKTDIHFAVIVMGMIFWALKPAVSTAVTFRV